MKWLALRQSASLCSMDLRLWLGLVLPLLFLTGAPVAWGEDTRPQEIRYETPGPFPLIDPSAGFRRAVVLLTDDRLSPRLLRLQPGQTVAWRSMAREPSRITFEREVARSMVCHSLVNFHLEGDELRSDSLRTGDVASFCDLAPGTYRYRVDRDAAAAVSGAGSVQLSSRLEGVIVVEAPKVPAGQRVQAGR